MSDRVPHVLSWLVRRRRVINGHLDNAVRDKARANQECSTKVRRLDLQIATLKRDLAALDATVAMQDIQVDPARTGKTRPHVRPRRTGYGQMTSAIYKALGEPLGPELPTERSEVGKAGPSPERSPVRRFQQAHHVCQQLAKIRAEASGIWCWDCTGSIREASVHQEGAFRAPAPIDRCLVNARGDSNGGNAQPLVSRVQQRLAYAAASTACLTRALRPPEEICVAGKCLSEPANRVAVIEATSKAPLHDMDQYRCSARSLAFKRR
jgi:hypothetical protein